MIKRAAGSVAIGIKTFYYVFINIKKFLARGLKRKAAGKAKIKLFF